MNNYNKMNNNNNLQLIVVAIRYNNNNNSILMMDSYKNLLNLNVMSLEIKLENHK